MSLISNSVVLSSGSLSSGVSEGHLELLANVSQCSDKKCSDDCCFQLRKQMDSLEAALKKGPSNLDQENMVTLRLLHEHYTYPCSSPNCHVPWCRFMSYRCPVSQENTKQELTTLLTFPMLTLLPRETQFTEIIKFDTGLDSGVDEWKDWMIISPLSRSYTVALATPVSDLGERSSYWVVKMMALQEDDSQLKMLKKLRGLQHAHVINHIWAASCECYNILVICTEFLPGLSVRDVLDERELLSFSETICYFLQVLNAAQWLHELNIVYLNWTCCNLLLDQRGQTLKVCNLGTSIDLSAANMDIGTIILTLPPDIVPAELLLDKPVSHRTDSWGLTCVVHEMLTGVRPWHGLRHESREEIRKQILAKCPPDLLTTLPPSVGALTQTCLQRCSESRMTVTEMMEHTGALLD